MQVFMALRIAFRAILRNKMRSFLTMLGVVIGVASVITMIAIGTGAGQSVQASIASLGTNTLMISPGSVTSGGVRTGAFGSSSLTPEDAAAILRECPAVGAAAPVTQNSAQIIAGGQNWQTSVIGTSPAYFEVRNWTVREGDLFTDDDVRVAAKVCLLGRVVADQLFGGDDAIGQIIRVRNVPMRVVGILSEKGDNAFGTSQDDVVVIPYTTAMNRLFNLTGLRQILASARQESLVNPARRQITDLLLQRHRIQNPEEADFTVRTQAEFAQTAAQSTQVFTLLLSGIASVSLLVGGIGIMNIMLVSVTERVREIGIRMAIGARARDIQIQFLLESLVLSLVGGLLGVGVAFVLTRIAARITTWTLVLSPSAVLMALGVSVAIGVFFGLYPAVRASRLDPIQALRTA